MYKMYRIKGGYGVLRLDDAYRNHEHEQAKCLCR